MTQVESAKELNVAQNTVSTWETGAAYPSTAKLTVIAKLYGCTVDDLLWKEET